MIRFSRTLVLTILCNISGLFIQPFSVGQVSAKVHEEDEGSRL